MTHLPALLPSTAIAAAPLPKVSSHKVTLVAPNSASQGLRNLVHVAMDLLPPFARDLVRLVGEHDALCLIIAAKGTLVYVPQRDIESHALAHVMSGRGWAKFCNVYGGQRRIQIPRCTRAILHLRNAQMVADSDQMYKGAGSIDYNALAIKYHLTHRQCERILASAPHDGIAALLAAQKSKDTRTLDLF